MSAEHNAFGRLYVTLAIYSIERSPQEITNLLGVEPDRITEKGAKLALGKTAPRHSWFLSTQDKNVDGECEDQILWLLTQVPSASAVGELVRQGDEARIWIYWDVTEINQGLWFSSPVIEKLAEIGASLAVDTYMPS